MYWISLATEFLHTSIVIRCAQEIVCGVPLFILFQFLCLVGNECKGKTCVIRKFCTCFLYPKIVLKKIQIIKFSLLFKEENPQNFSHKIIKNENFWAHSGSLELHSIYKQNSKKIFRCLKKYLTINIVEFYNFVVDENFTMSL